MYSRERQLSYALLRCAASGPYLLYVSLHKVTICRWRQIYQTFNTAIRRSTTEPCGPVHENVCTRKM